MYRSFASLAFVFVLTVTTAALSAENSLFSSVRVDAVFPRSGETAKGTPPSQSSSSLAELPTKLTDAGQLSRMLRKAGFEPDEISSRAVAVKKQLDRVPFPLRVTISDDESRLGIVLLLSTVKDEKQISTSQLLRLLEANRQYSPSFFAYSSQRKRLELCHSMRNQDVTGQLLKAQIDRLVILASKTEKSWRFGSTSAQDSAGTDTGKSEANSLSLAGKWSVARSRNAAFAVQFNTDGTFQLIYIKQGQQTRSSGKFTLQGQTLTLAGEKGLRLTGTVSSQSDTEFRFLPRNSSSQGSALVFKKAS